MRDAVRIVKCNGHTWKQRDVRSHSKRGGKSKYIWVVCVVCGEMQKRKLKCTNSARTPQS